TCTLQRRHKEALSTEKHRLQVAGPLNVVADRVLKGHNAACIHQQLAARQPPLDDRAACMNENHAIAAQALQNEALTAKQPGAKSFIEGDANFGAQSSSQERILLAN